MKPEEPALERPLALGRAPISRKERRGHWRFRCQTPLLTRLYVPDSDASLFAWMHDLSLSGAAFELLTPVDAGKELIFQLRTSEAGRLDVQALVVHSTQTRGFCRLGCRLSQPMATATFRAVVEHLRGQAVVPVPQEAPG